MFKIKSEDLKHAVSSLARGVRKATAGEKLIFIKTLEPDMVSFYFNGDTVSVERKVNAELQAELEVATTVREIDMKVNALPNDVDVIVEKKGNFLKLIWGRKNEILVDLTSQTSPLLEIPAIDQQVKWVPKTLHGLVRSVVPFSADPNSQMGRTRPILTGPRFSKDKDTGEVYVRVIDGHKGVTARARKLEWFEGLDLSIDKITMQALAELLPEEAEISVGVNKSSSLLVFSSGSTTVVARLLEGEFPNIDSMYIDVKKAKSKWLFDRQELIEVCRRVKKLTATSSKVEFRIKDGKVFAVIPKVLNEQLGVSMDGEHIEFAANAEYLEMAANLFRSDEVQFILNGPLNAITIQEEGKEDDRVLVLPIRVQ